MTQSNVITNPIVINGLKSGTNFSNLLDIMGKLNI